MQLSLLLWYILLLACYALTQRTSANSGDWLTVTSTRSCTKPPDTVYIYTSDGATYVVTNLGSTTLPPATEIASTACSLPAPGRPSTSAVESASSSSVLDNRTYNASKLGYTTDLPDAHSVSSASLLLASGDSDISSGPAASPAANSAPLWSDTTSSSSASSMEEPFTNSAGQRTGTPNVAPSTRSSPTSAAATSSSAGSQALSATNNVPSCPAPSTVKVTPASYGGLTAISQSPAVVTSYVFGTNATCPAPATLPPVTIVVTESLSQRDATMSSSHTSSMSVAMPSSSTFVPSTQQPSQSAGVVWRTETTYITAMNGSCSVTPIGVTSTPGTQHPSQSAGISWRTETSYISALNGSCPAAATTTVTTYLSYPIGSIASLPASSPAITSSGLHSPQSSLASTTATNATSAPLPNCPQTITSVQPGMVVTSTAYQTAASCPAMTTLPAITSYVYRSGYSSAGANATFATLTTTIAGATSYISAEATSCPSLAPLPAVTSYVAAPNMSCPSTAAGAGSITTYATTVYSCISDRNGSLLGATHPSALTVTSYLYGSGSTCTAQPLGTTTVTSIEYGSNRTVTVQMSANNSICSFTASQGTIYTTIYRSDITVTQAGSTVTLFAPSASGGQTCGSQNGSSPANGTAGVSQSSSSPSSQTTSTDLSSVPTQMPIVANASTLQQQSSSSDPSVWAQVVNQQDNPPIAPASNASFLLVTFGNTSSTSSTSAVPGSKRKRQASAQPLVYNATQSFSALAGGIYNLSASAADAQNGDTAPNCAITICGENTCGPSNPISTSFAEYSYALNAATTENTVATFSIQCVGQAYVALDNVTVTPLYVPQVASASTSASVASSVSSRRSASVRTVTTSIFVTTTAYGTQTATISSIASSFIITTDYETATSLQNITTTLSSLQISTSKLYTSSDVLHRPCTPTVFPQL